MIDETNSNRLKEYERDAIFRIGEVISVNGRGVTVRVDSNKNMPHILYQGRLIKGVAVGSYVKITKGFCSLVGKVESEELRENKNFNPEYHKPEEEFIRCLYLKLIGFFDEGKYKMGVREMPLIGNICYLLSVDEFSDIHSFCGTHEECISLGHLLVDEQVEIKIGINKLFTTHLGIFGNTGSGKSYTLAAVLKAIFEIGIGHDLFQENSQFVVFDFNGEYSFGNTIFSQKTVYKLNTHTTTGDKIPFREEDLLDPEIFYIMASASEKTQQPFIRRTIKLYKQIYSAQTPIQFVRKILKRTCFRVLNMKDHIKGKLLLDYFNSLLTTRSEGENLIKNIDWSVKSDVFFLNNGHQNWNYFSDIESYSNFENFHLWEAICNYKPAESFIDRMIEFMYITLIQDVLDSRALNDHIAPAINKLKSFSLDFSKIITIGDDSNLWNGNNLMIIDLNGVNTKMKKMIPLLLSLKLYRNHKEYKVNCQSILNHSLHIIIDEAHNILSHESNRESETWKDFRLEVFEEIIKEGRKFGVFLILASQRPSDISHTIVSQLHNYLIHRLVNNRDIEMVEKAISYIDKVSIESLPILPVGCCVLSGTAIDLPIIVKINYLPKEYQPQSDNIDLISSWDL